MTVPQCGIHHCEMRWKEGGISKKTKKSYPGFWSCPEKDEYGEFCKFRPEVKTASAPQIFESKLNDDVRDQKQQKIRDEVASGNAWGNAKTNAVNIVLKLVERHDQLMAADVKVMIEEWSNWLFNLEPHKPETK